MSKRQTLMLFGVIVILFLFLGFPALWDKIIAIFCGLIIIFISLRLKPEPTKVKRYSFVEHKNTEEFVPSKTEKADPIADAPSPDITQSQSSKIS